MPIGDTDSGDLVARQFENIYGSWIKPAVEELVLEGKPAGMICHRADKDLRPGEIITHVIEAISDADVVIADLTGRNANVFYELGVRHSLRNNTILISQDVEDIPFDLRGLRAICYRYEPESLIRLKKQLQETLSAIVTASNPIDNPVRRFLYDRELAKLVAAPVPPGYDALRQVIEDMQAVRNDLAERMIEIRALVEHSTSSPSAVGADPPNLLPFEGAWTSVQHGGLYIFKVVGSELRAPYCFMSEDRLNSHFFNFSSVGEQLICRFRWLTGGIEGCVLFTEVDKDRLNGGWWYLKDVPQSFRRDLTKLHRGVPQMVPLTLTRTQLASGMPDWAAKYFEKESHGSFGETPR